MCLETNTHFGGYGVRGQGGCGDKMKKVTTAQQILMLYMTSKHCAENEIIRHGPLSKIKMKLTG